MAQRRSACSGSCIAKEQPILHRLGQLFQIRAFVWIARHFRGLDQLIEPRDLRAQSGVG
jgi:hypothetical protein